MIWYYILKKNPNKDFIQKIVRINEFSKVVGYKINTQKYAPFLCTNNELPEEKLREQPHSQLHKK